LPVAVIVLFAFVVAPLLPLDPRQVCEKFIGADTEREKKKYTTLNLRTALNTPAKADCELTDEAVAPADVGGYFVGFRIVTIEDGQHTQKEGVFHLVHYAETWKIEDMYIMAINGTMLESWFSLSKNPQQFAQPSPAQAKAKEVVTPKTATKPPAVAPQKQWYQNQQTWQAVRGGSRLLIAGPAIGAFLLAIVGGIFRFGKGFLGLFTRGSAK